MKTHSKWTHQQIRRARQVALKPLLEQMGFRLQELKNGNSKVYDLPIEVVVKQTYWVCPETGTGGNAIDLLVHVIGMSFSEAMNKLQPFI